MTSPLFKRKTFEETDRMEWMCEDSNYLQCDIRGNSTPPFPPLPKIPQPPAPPVNGFQIGDRVRIYGYSSTGSYFDNVTGTIDKLFTTLADVNFRDGSYSRFHFRQLRKLKKRREIWIKYEGEMPVQHLFSLHPENIGPGWVRFLEAKPY